MAKVLRLHPIDDMDALFITAGFDTRHLDPLLKSGYLFIKKLYTQAQTGRLEQTPEMNPLTLASVFVVNIPPRLHVLSLVLTRLRYENLFSFDTIENYLLDDEQHGVELAASSLLQRATDAVTAVLLYHLQAASSITEEAAKACLILVPYESKLYGWRTPTRAELRRQWWRSFFSWFKFW